MPIKTESSYCYTKIMIETKISISESMRSALHLWKKHFVKIISVGFIIYLPTQICIELLSIWLDRALPIEDSSSIWLMNNIYNLVRYLIGSVALLGIINFIMKVLNGEDEQNVSEIILHGLNKWGKFIGLGLLAGLKIFLYSILLIIPGIYKSVRLAFIDCTIATSNNIFTDELDESEQLVENRWWKVFGFLLLLILLELLFELIFVPFILYFESHIMSIAIGVVIKIFETYFIVVKACYYFNLKKSREASTISNESE